MIQRTYPLKFKPIFKEKIWGGQKIKQLLDLNFSPLPNCGEAWVVSAVDNNVSIVAEGALEGQDLKSLITEYKSTLVGDKIYREHGSKLPLLIKFLDAHQDLSIQVHPDDQLAQSRHGKGAYGKTEMWYIIQADEDASLISGFNQKISQKEYLSYLNSGQLEKILHKERAQADNVFFIPAGRVHTIGKGLLLAEIQQTSDITYRIYDFDRKDAQGNLRELHTEEALDAIDYNHYDEYITPYQNQEDKANTLVSCQYFETNRVNLSKPLKRDYHGLDSFVIYIGLEGSLQINYDNGTTHLKMGEAIMVPAEIKNTELNPCPKAKILETYIP